MSSYVAIIQTVIIGLIFGLVYLQLTYDQNGLSFFLFLSLIIKLSYKISLLIYSIQNMNGVLFLLLINNSMTNAILIVNTFPAEVPIFIREHQNGVYSVISYYLSKTLIDVFYKFILDKASFIIIFKF